MFSWRARRQIIILFIAALPIAAAAFLAISKVLPEPSCTDNRKNQGELGVDCGGPCAPCELKNPKPISLFWTRVVPVRAGSYDAAAQIQNLNETLSSANMEYEFILFDGLTPIATRRGKTFLLAQERIHVIEANIVTAREPNRVEFKITKTDWQFRQETKPNFIVERRDWRVEEDNGRKKSVLEASVANRSPFSFKKAEVQAIILGKDGNLLGVSRTILENFLSGKSETVKFIWPEELRGEITSIEVEPRVNIFDSSAVLLP